MTNNDMYHANGNGNGLNGNGHGEDYYEKHAASSDDEDYEPCTKKILPCLFAWCLLISSSAAYFTIVLPMYIEMLGNSRFSLFILVVVVHSVLLIYVVLNFIIATFMDPGRFPKVDVSDGLEPNDVIGNVQTTAYKNVLINDINVRMKWCSTCQFYRPPRSSHCAVCNACIDTMDHHCPWVCNCIARRNYRYFLQFLVSLTIHMLIVFGMSLALVLLKKDHGITNMPIVVALFLIILITILIIPIGGLTGFHLILVSRGRTTNEQVTGKFRTGVNPFDEGCISNWGYTMCPSMPPSYIEFRRKKQKRREYLQTRMMLKLQTTKTSTNSKHKVVYHQNQRGAENNSSIKIISNNNNNTNNNNNSRTKTKRSGSNGRATTTATDQSELERKFNQYLTHSEQQTQHVFDDEDDDRVWLNRDKKGAGVAVRQQQYRDEILENETSAATTTNSRRHHNQRSTSSSSSKTAIERIMMEEKRLQQMREKERLISSSRNTGDEASSLSTNASSRYIRNNSYLNANPTLNVIANGNGPNPGMIYDMRSSSSNSNQSNVTTGDTRPLNPPTKKSILSGKQSGKKPPSQHHHHHNFHQQPAENNTKANFSKKQHQQQHQQQQPQPQLPPNGYDYGSYEITV